MASLQTHTTLDQAKRDATNPARFELWVLSLLVAPSANILAHGYLSDKSGGNMEVCMDTVSGRPWKREMVAKHLGVKISILTRTVHNCRYEGHQEITY